MLDSSRLYMRLIPTDDVSAYDVLEKGLQDLADLCDVVVDKFTVSRDAFNEANPRPEAS